MASFWHLVSLVLIIVGSVLIVVGFLDTDLSHGGKIRVSVERFRQITKGVFRRRSTEFSGTADSSGAGTLEAFGSAIYGPLDASLSDAEKIALIYEIVRSMQVEGHAALESQHALRRQDRAEAKAASDQLQETIVEIRTEIRSNIKNQALEGLGTALVGAILLGVGDIIGGVIPLLST